MSRQTNPSRCKKCGLDKPLTAFSWERMVWGPDGQRVGTCKLCSKRTCGRCGRRITSFRALPGGEYECRYERQCVAPRRYIEYGRLNRLGTSFVLKMVETHEGNLAEAARSLGVSYACVYYHLYRKASRALLSMPRKKYYKLTDPNQLARCVRRYNGCFVRIAEALGCHRQTVSLSARRLIPELYQAIQEQRLRTAAEYKRWRNRPKQDPALHPWRRPWASRRGA